MLFSLAGVAQGRVSRPGRQAIECTVAVSGVVWDIDCHRRRTQALHEQELELQDGQLFSSIHMEEGVFHQGQVVDGRGEDHLRVGFSSEQQGVCHQDSALLLARVHCC